VPQVTPPSVDFKPDPAFERRPKQSTLESVIGVNNLLGVAWLSRGTEVAAAVGRVIFANGDAAGTGFLVGPDLLLTNHHVLSSPDVSATSFVQFNYQLTWSGQPTTIRQNKIVELVKTDSRLDYSILRVDGSPGDVLGFMDPADRATVAVNDAVVIIQHPNGDRKQIALQDNQVSGVFGDLVQYTTDTQPGSSGSPILNNRWQIIGLHHAGGSLPGPGGSLITTNEGIQFSSIVRDAAGLLGPVSRLVVLLSGDFRRDLRELVETGDPADMDAAAKNILIGQPTLADDINAEADNTVAGGPDAAAVIAGAASSVALALAFDPALTHGFNPVSSIPPGPDPQLAGILSPILTSESKPDAAYARATAGLRQQPDAVSNLVNFAPGLASPRRTVTLFLRALSAGCQAISNSG
jgi:Trypsin-like peptidase domain